MTSPRISSNHVSTRSTLFRVLACAAILGVSPALGGCTFLRLTESEHHATESDGTESDGSESDGAQTDGYHEEEADTDGYHEEGADTEGVKNDGAK